MATARKTPEPERMDGKAFAKLRQALGKSQRELAALLGLSQKAVESYEQGWRKVPAHVERVLYFLLFKLDDDGAGEGAPCWEALGCPEETRSKCVAFVAKEGRFCWFFTGKLCARAAEAEAGARGGEAPAAGRGGLGGCYSCPVFAERLSRARIA
jgi:transcriptional regulator with XRE-family HTH domain